MSINFPSTPTTGQKFDAGAHKYYYSGGVWNIDEYKALFNNRLVNGAFQHSQQYGSGGGSGGGVYPADQWVLGYSSNVTVSAARYFTPNDVGANEQSNTGVIYLYSPQSNVTTNGYHNHFYTFIEGNLIADFLWGTAQAMPAVLRFWVMCSTVGTYSISIRNQPSTHCFVTQYTIAASDKWQMITIPIPAPPVGSVWATDNAYGLQLSIGPMWFTPYLTSTVGWQTPGEYYAITGSTNHCANAASYFRICQAGLYLDPFGTGIAPIWEPPDWAEEELRCMRYWYKCYSPRGIWSTVQLAARVAMPHPVQMRIPPTCAIVGGGLQLYDAQAGNTLTVLNNQYSNTEVFEMDVYGPGVTFIQGRAAIVYHGTGVVGDSYIAVSAR